MGNTGQGERVTLVAGLRRYRPKPSLLVDRAEQMETGKRLLEKTERGCPVAKSLTCRATMGRGAKNRGPSL
jgi:hypothetical protein